MKILAIRGKNLASLSAEFEIDFQKEPLASAGLYAITGPTGSGKSTLLDALCLALYERTPRLMKASAKGETIPDVGDNTVTPSDPRTILRRGAGEGFAEVDFVGSDGVSYRSRWSTRRAHGKANGKLQASEITLIRIADGQRLGDHTKTATLSLIEACIGLSFDQFTRAVLLAQNDFATFLKAPDDERAELLQTLTGTETFSDISKQAFVRMKTENETLARLNDQLKDQQPMDTEVRAGKTAEIQAQSDSVKLLELQKAGIEGNLRWYAQLTKHQVEQGEASAKLDAALAADLDATPRYAHLALVEQVQPARPLWTECERLSLAVKGATQADTDANAALVASQDQAKVVQATYEAARFQAEQAEAAKTNAQGDINRARALDASIEAITPQVQAAMGAQADAQKRLDQALAAQADTVTKNKEAQAQLQKAQGWLTDNEQLCALAEGWQRWDALFAQAQTTLASQGKSEAEIAVLSDQAEVNAKEVLGALAGLNRETEIAAMAAQELAMTTLACASLDADQLARDKKVQEDNRSHLQAASLLWQRRTEAQDKHQKFLGQQKAENATFKSSEAEVLACEQERPKLEGQLSSAEQALHLAKLAASKNALTMRADLQPEQPCPVCGALDHPYAIQSPAVDAMLLGLQDHVKTCKEALRKVLDRIAHATANKASAAKALDGIAQELVEIESLREKQLSQWTELSLFADLEALPETGRQGWLLARQDEVRIAIEQLTLQESAHRENLKRKEDAQKSVNGATKAVDDARQFHNNLVVSSTRISLEMDAAKRTLKELAAQLEGTLAQLDGAFTDTTWRQLWAKSSKAFVAQCNANANTWAQQKVLTTNLAHSIEGLLVKVAAADNACAVANQQLEAQTAALSTVNTTLQGYQLARGKLFDGKVLAEVESGLSAAIELSKAALDASQRALKNSESEITRLQEAVRNAALLLAQHRTELGLAQTTLDNWLATFNAQHRNTQDLTDLTLSELKPLLSINPAWISAERDDLQSIKSAVAQARAVLATRMDSLSQHEASKATSDNAETLEGELLKAKDALAILANTLSVLRLDIARDDERLLASSALRLKIDQQATVARVWSQLGELIGSADGKKFRNFAQQLTLDILLGYGNKHLQSLTSRYRLERIKDSLGLLVVDQEMGDEVRSVHSLSGGESFLVSLAMALGLASLSSHRVRVESLFIDEGFGSLDADSLRVAMDALDSLQAQGRKVGVISHVQEMTERIGTRVQVQRQAGGLSRIVVA